MQYAFTGRGGGGGGEGVRKGWQGFSFRGGERGLRGGGGGAIIQGSSTLDVVIDSLSLIIASAHPISPRVISHDQS